VVAFPGAKPFLQMMKRIAEPKFEVHPEIVKALDVLDRHCCGPAAVHHCEHASFLPIDPLPVAAPSIAFALWNEWRQRSFFL
jgi:hypothetical protein